MVTYSKQKMARRDVVRACELAGEIIERTKQGLPLSSAVEAVKAGRDESAQVWTLAEARASASV